jgi:hypothetical protein
MKTSTKQARNLSPTIGKIVMALALASVMSGISVTPALARDNDRNNRHHERDRHENRSQYRNSYNYAQPAYAPPPVYYAPQQSPGISLFFPLDFRR